MVTKTIGLVLGLILALPVAGQWTLDRELQWQTLETEHFRIHFHQGLEGVAHEVALIAEEAYAALRAEFGAAPKKLDLVLKDTLDITNAFAIPVPNYIGIFASQARLSDWSTARVDSWWKKAVIHELAHAIELDRTTGLAEHARKVLGEIVMPNVIKPWAFVEGLAVYIEYKYLGESRLNDARTRAMLRQMVADNAIPTFDELRQFYDRQDWPPGRLLIYNFSAWFMLYIEETYGTDALRKINDVNASRLDNLFWFVGLGADFDGVVREALGVSIADLYSGFRAWLRKQFEPEIKAIEAAGVTRGLRLTRWGFNIKAPAWSPDGQWIAYLHWGRVRQGIRLVRPDGGEDRELVSGMVSLPAWTPDSKALVYTRLDYVKPYHSPYYVLRDLYMYDLATGHERRLTEGERAYFARVSPDGRYVYYARNIGRDGSTAIGRLDLITGSIEPVAEFPGSVVHSFALSPDGTRIALALWRRGGFQDLYLMAASGGELIPLTQNRYELSDPCWTPDGTYILFSADPDRRENVYAYSIADKRFYQVTRTMTYAGMPTVSPDNAWLAFVGYSSDGYDIYKLPLNPKTWTVVTFPAEKVPQWTGYPKTDYPITPYNPIPRLMPQFWVPFIAVTTLGVATAGMDPLFTHYYFAVLGWDWVKGELAYLLSYTLTEPFSVSFAAWRWEDPGHHQKISLTLPLMLSLNAGIELSLSYTRAALPGKPESHTFAAALSFNKLEQADLWLRGSSRVLDGSITLTSAGRHHHLLLSLEESLRLPFESTHWLGLRVKAAWTDSADSAHHFSLGGTVGQFTLPGFPEGVAKGSQVVTATLRYDTPVLAIQSNILGHRPLFLDTVWISFVAKAGVVGQELDLNQVKVSFGLELTLSGVVSYMIPMSVTVGLAQGVGRLAPVLYISIGSPY